MTKKQAAAKAEAIAKADEIREMTRDQISALPGILGRVASAMTAYHGFYGYVESPSNRKVCIVVRG